MAVEPNEAGTVASEHQVADLGVEPLGPIEPSLAPAEVEHRQVVDDVAAGDDEHAVVTQWCEALTKLEVVRRRLAGIDRELHDRNVSVGVQVTEHAPCSVIQPPAIVIEPDPHRVDDASQALGQLWVTRRRILEREQLRWEAEEVVDRARCGHRRHCGRVDEPVGRDAQDRPRPPERPIDGPAELVPALGVSVVFERVHWAPVPDEHRRHPRRRGHATKPTSGRATS